MLLIKNYFIFINGKNQGTYLLSLNSVFLIHKIKLTKRWIKPKSVLILIQTMLTHYMQEN